MGVTKGRMGPGTEIPPHHPVRELFHTLTERGLQQSNLRDIEIQRYLSDLLVEFIHMNNLYKLRDESGRRLEHVVDMLEKLEGSTPSDRREIYKHVGDFTLFILGLFPESLSRSRRCLGLNYYVDQGRRSYLILSELGEFSRVVIFRKLSEQFESCVYSLNWVRQYINDPFYQYLFREFDVT
jgi:hypothetical protein